MLRKNGMTVVVVDTYEGMAEYIAAWDRLAAAALEANPFYESWMLMPALEYLRAGKDILLVLIFASKPGTPESEPAASRVMSGLFPLERTSHYRGLPVTALKLWQHEYCFFCVPLILPEQATETLAAFFDWLASADLGGELMEFRSDSGGAFELLLSAYIIERKCKACLIDSFARALFRPRADGTAYICAALSGKRRKELRRQQKLLSIEGILEYVALEPSGDLQQWIAEFLRLEEHGWKGRAGTAFKSRSEHRMFFERMAREAFARGHLMMIALVLNGRQIASKCNLLTNGCSFAFKIAFDEDYARFSPGVLLEIENIQQLHKRPDISWMDSCAVENHPMIDRLWLDRRIIKGLLVSTGRGSGRLVVLIMPFARWLKRNANKVLMQGSKFFANGSHATRECV